MQLFYSIYLLSESRRATSFFKDWSVLLSSIFFLQSFIFLRLIMVLISPSSWNISVLGYSCYSCCMKVIIPSSSISSLRIYLYIYLNHQILPLRIFVFPKGWIQPWELFLFPTIFVGPDCKLCWEIAAVPPEHYYCSFYYEPACQTRPDTQWVLIYISFTWLLTTSQ